jgi:hypothetical protein
MIELEDMDGRKFTEGDFVIFADQLKSLRIAKVRGIKPSGRGFQVALEIVKGLDTRKKRYSRSYIQHDFYKVDYTTDGSEL